MMHIEKIKSEDLAAQVQDANPGNFAIEQDVAQLVGATVPQPTQPSADDARELGAQLLVFLRRALTPIQTALRTAVAAIYAHLDSRCTDYTPAAYAPFTPTHHAYDPMGSTPRTLPNLLTAITAFDSRKIDVGSMNVPDGMCLWRIFGNKAMQDQIAVSMQGGNDEGWVYDSTAFNNWFVMFAEAEDLIIPCGSATVNPLNNATLGNGTLKTKRIIFPFAKSFKNFSWHSGSGLTPMESATVWVNEFFDLIAPELLTAQGPYGIMGWGCPKLRKLWFPKLTTGLASVFYNNMQGGFDRLICLNVGELTTSTNMGYWTASMALRTDTTASDYVDLREDMTLENNLQQFLQNFKEHIALRLTSNGSGKTLTLSQAVRNAIHAAEATYGIEAIIVTQKGWTLSPAPTA